MAAPIICGRPGLFVLLAAALLTPAHAGALRYPPTERGDTVETMFGEEVADPYRWLEQDLRTDKAVGAWVDAENRLTASYLDTLQGRPAIEARLRQLWNYERFGVPRKRGSHYFYMHNSGLQSQSVLFVRDGLSGKARALIDPNSWPQDAAMAIDQWVPSQDGALLAYSVQYRGSDWRTLHIVDVVTGKLLDDQIDWVKFSGIAWDGDGGGFFYSRFPEPPAGAAYQQVNLGHQVWHHAIGTSQSADRLVYATPDRPELNHGAVTTEDGRYLLIISSQGTDERYQLTLFDLSRPESKPRRLVRGFANEWALIGSIGSKLLLRTDYLAPNGRVVMIDVAGGIGKPLEIIPQNRKVLAGASLVGGRLILAYVGDATTEAELHELDGRLVTPINLPDIGTGAGFGGRIGDPETFFSFSSYAIPPTIYRLNTSTGKVDIFARPKLAFDPGDYRVEQLFYSSKDGTRIPIFIARKKSTPPGAPALLYGYGGFNVAQTPGFSPAVLQWMEMGGVYAVASLRGGGEYGMAWHDAGRLANKQNVFDDFITAGEFLISSGISAKGRLAAMGRSNGGLLVGAVVNQRPDLFAAVNPAVGVMDMLRFTHFTAGRYWVDDYGDPARADDFRILRGYSPYHNIRDHEDYPAIMVTTADTDDRVVPAHSFKYAAALQSADIGSRPHLLRVDSRAGHSGGRSTDQLIEDYADLWAFFGHWTGLTVPVAP
ncbi:prolyl oligopeptidase [Sphingomonas sp. YR710]|uniref:prolyl oligopeptidase family serine peptidase n=1 Tax=Sphingomonas sp. YR710 TaxID=1882773 RepID=UPI000890749A|nr:prolyl oligopeptidase family serine peptidase [Sphingomonas sp. YR710]SDD75121.1 prolyl oligopeptidase [Sphingomonas sp. YR710]